MEHLCLALTNRVMNLYHLTALCINVVVHVAHFIVGLQNSSQFSVSGHVEPSICGEDDQPGAAVPPTYFILEQMSGNTFD